MKPSHVRATSTLSALAAATVGMVALADPAAAAVTRHDGTVRYSWNTNCESVLLGYPYVEASMGLVSSVLYDDATPPKAGEVFYVVIEGAAIGDPYPCVGQKMRPDILLPAGFSLAVSAATPIRCFKWDYSGGGDPTSTPETALCPTAAQPPQSGGSASFGTAAGESWDMPQFTGYEIQVPVVSSGPATTAVDFAVRVLDGNTNPLINVTSDYVAIGAGPTTPTTTPTTAPTTPPTPVAAATVTARVAPVVKLDRTRGRVPVRLAAGPAGSTATVTIRARVAGRWVVAGRAAYDVASAAATTVKVRVGKQWRRALDGHRVKAKVSARVSAPSGDTAGASQRFWLRG